MNNIAKSVALVALSAIAYILFAGEAKYLTSADKYIFSTPITTNNIIGKVMTERGDYRIVRSEDISFLTEGIYEMEEMRWTWFANDNPLRYTGFDTYWLKRLNSYGGRVVIDVNDVYTFDGWWTSSDFVDKSITLNENPREFTNGTWTNFIDSVSSGDKHKYSITNTINNISRVLTMTNITDKYLCLKRSHDLNFIRGYGTFETDLPRYHVGTPSGYALWTSPARRVQNMNFVIVGEGEAKEKNIECQYSYTDVGKLMATNSHTFYGPNFGYVNNSYATSYGKFDRYLVLGGWSESGKVIVDKDQTATGVNNNSYYDEESFGIEEGEIRFPIMGKMSNWGGYNRFGGLLYAVLVFRVEEDLYYTYDKMENGTSKRYTIEDSHNVKFVSGTIPLQTEVVDGQVYAFHRFSSGGVKTLLRSLYNSPKFDPVPVTSADIPSWQDAYGDFDPTDGHHGSSGWTTYGGSNNRYKHQKFKMILCSYAFMVGLDYSTSWN